MAKPTRKHLEQALARYHLQLKAAKPTAEAAFQALLDGSDLPEIPESSEDLPAFYPYNALPDREARQLAFITKALPDKAAELQGLWLAK